MRYCWLALALAASLSAAPVVLVENSRPRAVIVSAPDAHAAAAELAVYIEEATGAKLPIAAAADSPGLRILVGLAVSPPEVRRELRDFGRDGFLIRASAGSSVVLAGNPPDGTAFAVYAFLERFVGVRWLWPGELGEIVPKSTSLRIEPVSIEQRPAFWWRSLGPGGALWGPLDKWTKQRELGVSEDHQRTERVWEKHLRFGGPRIYGGHAFGEILPPAKYGPTHPEYFALVNGKRTWQHFDGKHGCQPCTTNPDVIRITADYCRRFFDQHPEYDAFSISLNDGRGFCECDRCRRLDTGAIQAERGDPETGRAGRSRVITDRIVTFANQVAEQLAQTHPDKKLILFAYGQYKQPPVRVRPHPNLIIQYTLHASGHWDKAAEQREFQELEAWAHSAKQLAIYEYFVQGAFPDMPRYFPELIEGSVRRLHRLGYRYYQTQAGDGYALNGLNYYILAKLLWDPSQDAKAIQRDYVERGFGKAAPLVSRYFDRLSEHWRELAGRNLAMNAPTLAEYRAVAAAYPPEFRALCRRDLEKAAALASGQDRERVRFLQAGLRYFEMTLDAIEKTIPLLEAGWNLSRKFSAPQLPNLKAFKSALIAWEDRDRYVESLKNDFVLAYLWVRYNDQNRTFNPLAGMRQFEAR